MAAPNPSNDDLVTAGRRLLARLPLPPAWRSYAAALATGYVVGLLLRGGRAAPRRNTRLLWRTSVRRPARNHHNRRSVTRQVKSRYRNNVNVSLINVTIGSNNGNRDE